MRESFNAYGQRRGTAWSGSPSAGDITTINGLTRRGYTGHEMLDSTALVHMNGRVYDPIIARFVSADPSHDAALGTQAWNRFAYVGNNPLSRVDPSGFESRGPGRRPRSRKSGMGDDLTWLEIAQNRSPWFQTWGNGLGADGHPMMGATLSGRDFAQNYVLAGFRGATGPVTLYSPMTPLPPKGRADVLSEDNSECLLCADESSQDDNDAAAQGDSSPQGQLPELEEVVVTGTRTQQASFPLPPPGIPGGPWKWFPDPGNTRGGTFRDPSGRSISWDRPGSHWDFDDGKGGTRQRFDRWGNALRDAHGYRGPRVGPLTFPRAFPFIFINVCGLNPYLYVCQGMQQEGQTL